MDRLRLLELLDGYLEQRLDAAEHAALQDELVRSPQACRVFWECVHQHALLSELLAEARGRDLAAEEQTVPALAQLLRSRRRRGRWLFLGSMAAAAVVLVALGVGWLLWMGEDDTPHLPVVARLAEMRGDVQVFAEDAQLVARAGLPLRSGQEIRTGEGGYAVVTYEDSSRLELNADTAVRLLGQEEDDAPPSKRIFLVRGTLNAHVKPQPVGRPMILRTLQADVLAPQARFSSTIVFDETRIELEEGKALLAATGDGRTIEMHTGTYAVSAIDREVYKPTPRLPSSGAPFATLEEGSGPVLALSSLADDRTLAVGCWSGQVKLWDVRTRVVRTPLDAGRKRVLSLAGAPAGSGLAVGYEPVPRNRREPSLLVWDADRPRIVHELPGSLKTHALAWTPDGRSLVLASSEKAQKGLLVWDLGDRRERLALGDRDRVQSVAVSPNGRLAAAGLRDGRIRLWDLATGRLHSTLEGHQRDVQALAFLPTGDRLASGSRDGTVRLWSVQDGEELRRLTGPFNEVRCLAFAPDGQTLTTGHGGFAILWDVRTGRQQTTLKAHSFAVTALVYLQGGKTLATAGWDRRVKLWDLWPAGQEVPERKS